MRHKFVIDRGSRKQNFQLPVPVSPEAVSKTRFADPSGRISFDKMRCKKHCQTTPRTHLKSIDLQRRSSMFQAATSFGQEPKKSLELSDRYQSGTHGSRIVALEPQGLLAEQHQ